MSTGSQDELVHAVMHLAQMQQGVHLPFVWGHVAEYDPGSNCVRVLIPPYRDGTNAPVLSGWIPVFSPYVGDGWGLQVVLEGGASYTNPTGGELVVVAVLDDDNGAYVAIPGLFTAKMVTPSENGTPATLSPGEVILKHKSGTYLYFKADGSIAINSSKIGFFGAAPVAQPTLEQIIIDSTGGVASTTFAAIAAGTIYSQADMIAVKNALAQIAKSLNALTNAQTTEGLAHT